MTEIVLDTALAFTLDKQSAILGWSLRDPDFGAQCARSVKPEWFSSSRVAKLFAGMVAIWRDHHRLPTPQELSEYQGFAMEDAHEQQRIQEALANALQQTLAYGLDVLRGEMTFWMHAVIFNQALQRAVDTYNAAAHAGAGAAARVDEAWGIVDRAVLMRQTSSFEAGVQVGFRPAGDRLGDEQTDRVAQATRVIGYGIKYLTDTLGGIFPNDLIVLGAKTGKGKTTAATASALAISEALAADPGSGADEAAFYYALEAENCEIERRLLYSAVSNLYYASGPSLPPISYLDWRLGRLGKVLGPHEEQARELLRPRLARLRTLYRTDGDFTLQTLERSLLEIANKARFVVIDHLHYVDNDDDDENKAYKRIVKLVRDFVLRYSVPVMVIAHLRKSQGARNRILLPGVEDFHGTSDIPKIATTCIMVGPASDRVRPAPYLLPTYMAAVKARLDGSRTGYVGLLNYDVRVSRYEDSYRIGRLTDWTEEFEDLLGAAVPGWAQTGELTTDHSLG